MTGPPLRGLTADRRATRFASPFAFGGCAQNLDARGAADTLCYFVRRLRRCVDPSEGTAARQLDILPGDELVAVEGVPVSAASAEELEIALAGARNSLVRLAFERRRADGSIGRLERAVRRERTNDATAVPVATMLDSTTGYVRVTTFMGERVADDLHGALDRLEKKGMQRLVLDLRDNGGGSVAEAARVAGEFLPRGAVVYSSSGRKAEITDTGRVQRSFWRSERRYPIVVMVNAGTASASELVAGALQDHDRALIVGRPTFGKSLLMRGFPMSDGSVLVLVVGQIRTPCGRVVQREYRTMDVVLPELPARPRWLVRAEEQQLILAWSGSYLDGKGATLGTVESFLGSPLSSTTLSDFRVYALRQGVEIPVDGDQLLQQVLRESIAFAKWGAEGAYQVSVARDAAIREAVGSFSEAARILSGAR